jgi:3-phosphoshikimate 1-carboxyvinyltransferase
MRSLGADIAAENMRESSGEPLGDLKVRGSIAPARADGILISGSKVPKLIDELPVLAVAGTQIEGGLEVRGAAELRVKETDRIAAVVANLRRMNADIEEFDDGFRVARSQLKGADIDTFGDHRIAMAFAVAGLLAEGETNIDDAACVDVSFPGFFESLATLAYHRTTIPA